MDADELVMWLTFGGAFAFGLVVGWLTYRTLRHAETSGLSDIATVIGAVGGAAVTALFPGANGSFGAYCFGLAIGFFGYVIVALRRGETNVLGDQGRPAGQARHRGPNQYAGEPNVLGDAGRPAAEASRSGEDQYAGE